MCMILYLLGMKELEGAGNSNPLEMEVRLTASRHGRLRIAYLKLLGRMVLAYKSRINRRGILSRI
jgi:hypothetical protein